MSVKHFLEDNWALALTTMATAAVALWFFSRLIFGFIYFNDPRNADVDLEGWMTPRFIVMTYDLPRPFVTELLELPPDSDGGLRLATIAQDLGLSMDELTEKVRMAASDYRGGDQ